MISELIWEISKNPDLNYEFIDKILAMGGLSSQAEHRVEVYKMLNRDKYRNIDSEKIIIECEKCNKKLRVPHGKLIHVSCPSCKISFVYDGR
jgi:Zn finger protein HypA/HybF involved in hydrogenase expression